MLAGIREVLVITTPVDRILFENLLKDGSHWGLQITYAEQPRPRGLPEAFLIGEKFIGGDSVCMILGDNIFYGYGLAGRLEKLAQLKTGAKIFSYYVKDPQNYGVVSFDCNGKIESITEKPVQPKSNYAIPGIYFYDCQVSEISRQLRPSGRDELEITDLNLEYMRRGQLTVEHLGRGTAWLDTGQHDSLLQAAIFIQTVESRQGLKIGCPEEVAFRKGFITAKQLEKLAIPFSKIEYGQYLLSVLGSS